MTPPAVQIRASLATDYADVLTPAALAALARLASLDSDRKTVMRARIERRAARARNHQRIDFLDPDAVHPAHATPGSGGARRAVHRRRNPTRSAAAVDSGHGTGGAAERAGRKSIRNVAYALLSGADGWMFDGEDALGQVSTMSLDNQRESHARHPPRSDVHAGRGARSPGR